MVGGVKSSTAPPPPPANGSSFCLESDRLSIVATGFAPLSLTDYNDGKQTQDYHPFNCALFSPYYAVSRGRSALPKRAPLPSQNSFQAMDERNACLVLKNLVNS